MPVCACVKHSLPTVCPYMKYIVSTCEQDRQTTIHYKYDIPATFSRSHMSQPPTPFYPSTSGQFSVACVGTFMYQVEILIFFLSYQS